MSNTHLAFGKFPLAFLLWGQVAIHLSQGRTSDEDIGKAVAKERKRRAHKTSFSQPLVLQPLLELTFFKPIQVSIITYLLITLFSDLR